MDAIAAEYLDRLIGPFFDPQKRIFLGYLASALLIALICQFLFAGGSVRTAFAKLFSPRVWLSRSARADYMIMVLNQAVMMGVAPRLISKLVVATLLFEGLHVWFDGRVALLSAAPDWTIAAAFTIVLFLLDDLSKYLVHRALHRWPALWAFHKVHHSAEVLTPFTVYRTHPVEGVVFALRAILVQAVVIATFFFFFGDRASLVTVLGANAFLFLFNLAGSNLRHSHVWISYGSALERWLISPAQHQIHHSVEERHFDRNFGAVLAIWDRLGGSLCIADTANKPAAFGVEGESGKPHDLGTIYVKPFAEMAGNLLRSADRGWRKLHARLSSPAGRWTAGAGALIIAGAALLASPLLAG